MEETVKKEILLEKPSETWYRKKVDDMMAARGNGKKDLEVLHLGELQTGPGDLSHVEWEQKMLEEKLALHGERAYNAVNGPSGGKADDKH